MDERVVPNGFAFKTGDHVALVEDDWELLGSDIVLVDSEPVPGSTQCVVRIDGEVHTVSRSALRPAG